MFYSSVQNQNDDSGYETEIFEQISNIIRQVRFISAQRSHLQV